MYGPAMPDVVGGPVGWPAAAAGFPSPEAIDPAHVRWHYKSDGDKRWTPFDGFDSLSLEQSYRQLFPAPTAPAGAGYAPGAGAYGPGGAGYGGAAYAAGGAAYAAGGAVYPAEAAGDDEVTDVSQLLNSAGRGYGGGQAAYPGTEYGQLQYADAAHVRPPHEDPAPYGAPPLQQMQYPAALHQQMHHVSPSHVQMQTQNSAFGHNMSNGHGPADDRSCRVLVRGGMYEVLLHERTGRSLYWSGEQFAVTRGAWFYDGSWEPVDEPVACRVEQEHGQLARSGAWNQADPRAPRQALHHVEFEKFVVVWYSNGDVALHSGRVLSKVMRGLYQKLGLEGAGEPLRRSYPVPAVWEDRLPDIDHLIFVVHGIGQKMDSSSIIKKTASMREIGRPLVDKHFGPAAGRAEFIPVEWRSSLVLDAGLIDAITPRQMLGLRQLLNDSFMDIMYYTSPVYRDEVVAGLRRALNTVYGNFSRHYPRFEACGGRVSVVAHSLGCVILHDLVTGWRPHDGGVVSAAAAQLRGHAGPFHEIDKLRDLIETEVIHKMHLGPAAPLRFKIENLFCLGSPLSVFLTMRSQATGPHVIPANLCRRFFNVFYPHDPVAYRMEPLVSRYYAHLAPVQVHPHTAPNKSLYCELPAVPLPRTDGDAPPANPPPASAKQGWSLWTLMKGEKAAARPASCPGSPIQRSASIELDHRLDYVLRETGVGVPYVQVLTSHMSYWTNPDLVYFILHHVLTPEQPGRPSRL